MYVICKICGSEYMDNPDGICNDSKFSIINDNNITSKR